MNLLKSRFGTVLLCIAVVLVLLPTVLSVMGLGNFVSKAVQTVCYPAIWCFDRAADGIRGFSDYFTEFDRLREENESLRRELGEYLDAKEENEVLRAENRWLRSYLSLKNEHIDYLLSDASVISRESSSQETVFTVDRGSLHGIAEGMSVVTENGVFGYVREVALMSSKIVPIVETAVSVGAFTERAGATGICEGDALLRKDGLVSMVHIPAGADIAPGDYVYTSGTGSVYPRGLLIGVVESVELDPYSRTKKAVIRPKEDFTALDRVQDLMIITDFRIYTEEETTAGELFSE